MTWMVGIDEAGYGPNLGPLVMTAVACRMPADLPASDKKKGTCLWKLLRQAVRKPGDADDGRLVVGDSKLVYSTARGLADLEQSVLSTLLPGFLDSAATLARLVEVLCTTPQGLLAEAWYTGQSTVPSVAVDPAACRPLAERFRQTCDGAKVGWQWVRSVVVCPAQFNTLLDHWGSKGAVLSHALTELLQQLATLPAGPVHCVVDKHGGRNTYTAMLQNALEDGMIVAEREGARRSVYRVVGAARDVRFTIQPRADVEHFCVALASMVSKYLRERLMEEFNAFWQGHVTDLKPTAGYPGDAVRFYASIEPAVRRLGLAEDAVWRRK